jgi:hypothetical protein
MDINSQHHNLLGNQIRTADPFETWHKNRSSLKVVLFVFKIFKWPPI